MKRYALILALFLAACGGGEDDSTVTQTKEPVLRPPENAVCATTVPVPPDCPAHK